LFFVLSVFWFADTPKYAHAQQPTDAAAAEQHMEECSPYIRDYLKRGNTNDSLEVLKLQSFLKTVVGFQSVPLDGEFGFATENAVKKFQKQHADAVLHPWGYSSQMATGHVYITTVNKINEIICGRDISLTQAQAQEIRQFRSQFIHAESRQTTKEPKSNTTTARQGTGTARAKMNTSDENIPSSAETTSEKTASDEKLMPATTTGTTTFDSPGRAVAAVVYTSINNIFRSMIGFIFSWNFLFLLIGIFIGLVISPYAHHHPEMAEPDTSKQ
jgi:hypothetical protein